MENTWTVFCHDVWGNAKDGWQVNDNFKLTDELILEPNPTDRNIMEALKKYSLLGKHCQLRWLSFYGDDTSIIYVEQASNGYPLFTLYKNS